LHSPDFVVHPNGEIVPVPEGAMGPTAVESGKGFQFTGGERRSRLRSGCDWHPPDGSSDDRQVPISERLRLVYERQRADGQPLDRCREHHEVRSLVALAVGPVMVIEDLFDYPLRRAYAAMPEMDALTEPDALQEADLVDIRFDVSRSVVGLLFDLRSALQFRMANTALLVGHDVQRFTLSGETSPGRSRMAHYVVSSRPDNRDLQFSIAIGCLQACRLELAAASAEFFVGDIPDLPEAPPDFGRDDEATIKAGMPGWGSQFEPGWATFLGGSE
jgi:hypothetical protein